MPSARLRSCFALALGLVACAGSPGNGRTLASGGAGNSALGGRSGAGGAGKTGSSGASTGGASAGGGGSSLGGGAGALGVASYTTDFGLTESPLSETSAWRHTGQDWTLVVTSGGLAYGTQSGNGGFDDSYAYLAASFPANQSASATLHLAPGIAASYAEVELLLRWTDAAHNATGYECNLAFNGQYAEIIKWPGPLGTQKSDFVFVSSGNPVSAGVHEGDVFQADVIGNTITSRLNGKVLATGTDASIPSGGAPGIGFYSQGAPASSNFSFSHFSATAL